MAQSNGISLSGLATATNFIHPLGNGTLWTEARDSSDSWHVALNFGERGTNSKLHLAEDWNIKSGGDSDANQIVHAAALGRVVFAGRPNESGWGGVVIIAHRLIDGSYVETKYGHLQLTASNQILLPNGKTLSVGQDVGLGADIGKLAVGTTFSPYPVGDSRYESAHLHFEIHEGLSGKVGVGYATTTSGYLDPSKFLADHHLHTIFGNSGNNNLRGDDGSDSIVGGGGSDIINPRGGLDIIGYTKVSESTGANFDIVINFNGREDRFDFPFQVTEVENQINGGRLRASSFDGDLAKAVSGSRLDPHHAVLFTPSSGDYNGHTFLIVEANNQAGYQAGKDYVIDLVGVRPVLDIEGFI